MSRKICTVVIFVVVIMPHTWCQLKMVRRATIVMIAGRLDLILLRLKLLIKMMYCQILWILKRTLCENPIDWFRTL